MDLYYDALCKDVPIDEIMDLYARGEAPVINQSAASRCCKKKDVADCNGFIACKSCGSTTYGLVGETADTYHRKIRTHSRHKWMHRRCLFYTDEQQADLITGYFSRILSVIHRYGLVEGRNVSRYDYFIIRIAHHFRISRKKWRGRPRDMSPGTPKKRYDDILFDIVYSELGWQDEKDKYYRKWLRSLWKTYGIDRPPKGLKT